MRTSDSQAIELAMAYVMGQYAGAQGHRFSENPYPPAAAQRQEWARGWREGLRQLLLGRAA